MEIEYMTVIEALREVILLLLLLDKLGVFQEHAYVHCNSQSAIQLAKD